ncbi:MAG: DUF3662 and FHA domain-containing protein [Actinomycetes bacterium]
MNVLKTIESKLETLFEGVFGRAFKANVQPVELARKLVKEMDDHRSVSVSRVYVPNEYTLYLAPADREQFASYEDQLREELQDYLSEHARRERYVLLTAPAVKLETDDDLEIGVFGIATRLVRGAKQPTGAPTPSTAPGETMIYKPVEPAPVPLPAPIEAEPDAPEEIAEIREVATVTLAGRRHELGTATVVLGRSKDCDIQVPDPNASRRHAEIRHDQGVYTVVDLDSTNGIEVEGRRVKQLQLENGSRFTIGSTEVVFAEELA